MEDTIKISKSEYKEMKDYIERLQETIEVISDEKTVRKLNAAFERVELGEYLTKKDIH